MVLYKKGSQLEIVISFAIFVIFIILLFLVIRPSRFDQENNFLLKHLEESITDKIETSMIATSIANNTQFDSGKSCFSIPKINEGSGKNIVANDKDRNSVPVLESGERLYIGDIDGFFNIYFSDEINQANTFTIPSGGCDDLNANEYSLGLVKELNFLSTVKAQQLDNDMEDPERYLQIKSELGVPDDKDFGFFIKSNSGSKIVISENQDKLGSNVEIFATEFPISYIDENAKIEQGWLNIQVW